MPAGNQLRCLRLTLQIPPLILSTLFLLLWICIPTRNPATRRVAWHLRIQCRAIHMLQDKTNSTVLGADTVKLSNIVVSAQHLKHLHLLQSFIPSIPSNSALPVAQHIEKPLTLLKERALSFIPMMLEVWTAATGDFSATFLLPYTPFHTCMKQTI